MAAFTNLPVDLVIVRHGQSEANMMIEMTERGDASAAEAMQCAKRHDSEMRLTDTGRAQARTVGKWLRENAPPFDAFYCSQYVRTKETAAEMDLANAEWHADLMIRERDQGVQDGGGDVKLGLDETEQQRMEKSTMYWQPIAGESMADVVTRVRHFLETLSAVSAGLSVVVVCHYRTIHAFRILLEEIPQESYGDLLRETMPNCCIWWYSRRDVEGSRVHWQVASVKRIAVQPDGSADITTKAVTRQIFSNAMLLQQISSIPQVVNNGADGKGAVVYHAGVGGGGGDGAVAAAAPTTAAAKGGEGGEPADADATAAAAAPSAVAPAPPKRLNRRTMTGQILPPAAHEEHSHLTDHDALMTMPLTIVIFGATGDLARKKLFPALYQLVLLHHLPSHVHIVGYGRSAVDLDAFILKQCVNIKPDPRLAKSDFTARISFHAGGYDDPASYERLGNLMKTFEGGGRPYDSSASGANAKGGGYTRLMIEKPFGRDSQTFDDLNALTAKHFDESQLFRLDHYLGKEVIINIATLRWANQLFEPTWNAQYIESVQFTFKEDLGTGGRGGYFDGFGIIRDIIQNHLLQAFMWLAMEPPESMTGAAIKQRKVELLSCVRALSLDDPSAVFLGQFGRHGDDPGYLEDATVPAGSRCPTFAAVVLKVDSDRWRGVPFLFTAGKGMDERLCEVRVRYKAQPTNSIMGVTQQNELVLRVQPDESIYMTTIAKEPGITAEQIRKPAVMDMSYKDQFHGAYVGDAYERMFLNAARGDQALFVSAAELVEAWRIFTPLLHQIDSRRPQPVLHPFGAFPEGYSSWCRANGIEIRPTWQEFVVTNGAQVEQLRAIFNELDRKKMGAITFDGVSELARRFYDGRTPSASRVKKLFRQFDSSTDDAHIGRIVITFEEFLEGVQRMHRAFHPNAEDDVFFRGHDTVE